MTQTHADRQRDVSWLKSRLLIGFRLRLLKICLNQNIELTFILQGWYLNHCRHSGENILNGCLTSNREMQISICALYNMLCLFFNVVRFYFIYVFVSVCMFVYIMCVNQYVLGQNISESIVCS